MRSKRADCPVGPNGHSSSERRDVELFVIQCTTCRARLKVHDLAVIGQIIECPKCRSFVAVTAPSDWQSPGGSASPAGKLPATSGNPTAASRTADSGSSDSSPAAPDRPAAAGSKSTVSGAAACRRQQLPAARLLRHCRKSLAVVCRAYRHRPSSNRFRDRTPPTRRAAAAVGGWAPTRPISRCAAAAGTATEPAAEAVGSNRLMADAPRPCSADIAGGSWAAPWRSWWSRRWPGCSADRKAPHRSWTRHRSSTERSLSPRRRRGRGWSSGANAGRSSRTRSSKERFAACGAAGRVERGCGSLVSPLLHRP